MKRILLAAFIAGCVLGLGAQTVLAESVKVPVNKISGEGVGEAGHVIALLVPGDWTKLDLIGQFLASWLHQRV